MSDGENEDTDSIMQAMGFANFGSSQRPKKQPREPADGASSASGANSAPVAKRVKTNKSHSKLQSLSATSPSYFLPTSLPPQPTSAASIATNSSTKSYDTAPEQPQQERYMDMQPPPPETSLPTSSNYGTFSDLPPPPPGPSPTLSYSQASTTDEPPPSPSPPPSEIQLPAQEDYSSSYPGQPPQQASDAPAYTHPVTGISLTRQELYELRNGRRNGDGDEVFFQPSFVDEDPWAGLREEVGLMEEDEEEEEHREQEEIGNYVAMTMIVDAV